MAAASFATIILMMPTAVGAEVPCSYGALVPRDTTFATQVIRSVELELGLSVCTKTTTASDDLAALVASAESSTDADIYFVVAGRRGGVAIVRTEDRTALVRRFGTKSADPSAVAAAVVLLELLHLLERRPTAEPLVADAHPTAVLRLRLSGGVQSAWSPGFEGAIFQPLARITTRVQSQERLGDMALDLSVVVMLPSLTASRRMGDVVVNYARFGGGLELEASHPLGGVDLLVGGQLALSRSAASIVGPPGTEGDRILFEAGGALGVAWRFSRSLELRGALGLTRVFNPTDFLVMRALALAEGPWRARADLTLGWFAF